MNSSETINNKYKNKIYDLFSSYIDDSFSALEEVENYYYQDKIKIDIEAREKITYSEVAFYFDSLFDAKRTESFSLLLDKIVAVIKKYRLKASLDHVNGEVELDYRYLEGEVINNITKLINQHLPSKTKFSLSSIRIGDELREEQKMEGFIHYERFNDLVDLVLKMIPTLSAVVDVYGLKSVQDVEFSKERYLALEACFEKVEFTKKSTPDIQKMCDLLKELQEVDLNDVLSEEYARYTLAVLEVAHFVASFYVGGKSANQPAEKHKNETRLIYEIKEKLDYYMDYIDYTYFYNYVEVYPDIRDVVEAFNIKGFADKLINELPKK